MSPGTERCFLQSGVLSCGISLMITGCTRFGSQVSSKKFDHRAPAAPFAFEHFAVAFRYLAFSSSSEASSRRCPHTSESPSEHL